MTTHIYDPWKNLPDDVTVERIALNHCPAYTLGGTIWLDESLTSVEERCALTHELIHHERGHVGHQKAGVEQKVRYATALRLVPVIDYHDPDVPVRFAADEHGVTETVMADRLEIAHARAEDEARAALSAPAHWCGTNRPTQDVEEQ